MNISLDKMKAKLDLGDVDLVSPVSILENTSDEIERITKGLVKGVVSPYSGPIKSYSIASPLANLAATVALATRETYDIQADLGEIGYTEMQYDYCLTVPSLPNYKYRVMFLSIGIGGYPAELILQEDIAQEVLTGNRYIVRVQNRTEYETLVQRIFQSEKVISIIQELLYAAKSEHERSVNAADVISSEEQETASE